VKNIFITISKNNGEIKISVKDEGPGLSVDDKKKLFGKFARLSARPTGDEHSTGLGLSIVKKLVELIGAEINVESELGKGAEFIVTFQAE
jgi:signal transduction histidine kinase